MRRPARATLATALVAGGLAAVGTTALVDTVRTRSHHRAPEAASTASKPRLLEGARVPAPGALPGRLVLARLPGCRLQALDLATLRLGGQGPPTGCAVWPSPDGTEAVVARGSGRSTGLRELWLVGLGARPVIAARIGATSSAPAWSRDGRVLAWCSRRVTMVLALGNGGHWRLPGCYPAFEPDGTVVTRAVEGARTVVLRDGVAVLDERDAARAFPAVRRRGPVRVVGHGVTADGAIALAVERTGGGLRYALALELWRGGRLERALPITSYGPAAAFFGLRVAISPNGGEAAVLSPARVGSRPDDLVALVDLRSGEVAESLAEHPFAGLAWSPDGAWLALSSGAEIAVYGRSRGDPEYVLPVSAGSLAWLRKP